MLDRPTGTKHVMGEIELSYEAWDIMCEHFLTVIDPDETSPYLYNLRLHHGLDDHRRYDNPHLSTLALIA